MGDARDSGRRPGHRCERWYCRDAIVGRSPNDTQDLSTELSVAGDSNRPPPDTGSVTASSLTTAAALFTHFAAWRVEWFPLDQERGYVSGARIGVCSVGSTRRRRETGRWRCAKGGWYLEVWMGPFEYGYEILG